ncbi:UvrD-helicase domain-containing protein [Halopenitus sp. H-Gu1]|uniref:UvrD-helicase domain-containing protein n=1 Tax=Halopenitus sp. H-Gu1 TaxID=3242697 RepID=UPI00359E7410
MGEDAPIRIQHAQREIRDAYFQHESGLFTLDCVPGSGKSMVAHHVAAEDVLRRYVDGDPMPEQHVAVVSFNRNEASSIIPEVCDRLREIVEHDLVPVATEITSAELEHLIHRVRRAPYVGTIDGILRDVVGEIAHDVGFDGIPDVGNAARLQRVHRTCYATMRDDPGLASRLDRLEAAYPSEEYADDVREMLETAVSHCRDRRISTDELRTELDETLQSVYAEGPPESFDDVIAAVHRHVGSVDADAYAHLDADDRRTVVDADAGLHDEWAARLDDFCVVFDAYRRAYRERIREQGVVSHTDVAFLVDAYFDGRIDGIDEAHRIRIRRRYHTRIRSLIIDEAQDVSSIQHAALSHLVTPETRVFCSGDVLQSIYLWRHAEPTLFESATADGTYLGIDWDVHENRTATTTYRCLPDVADAINRIAKPVLTDPARGDLGELDVTYPGLEAARDATEETSVHVAAFESASVDPDSFAWINPHEGRGEATVVATFLSKGLADGTFTDENDEPIGITVLFRWSSKMEAYEEAFAEEGLSVRNASENLFDCPVVETVLDVCEWLVSPADPEHLSDLVTDSKLGLSSLVDDFETHQWNLDLVLDECDLTDAHHQTLAGLCDLRERRDRFSFHPASTSLEDVIDVLALRADPYDRFPDVDPARRVANLDALIATLEEWESDEHHSPREVIDLLEPFRETPRTGPNQPSTAEMDHDVEFRTVHDAKGDQDDVVVIANPGFDLRSHGPHANRLLTRGTLAGLAPPTDADVPTDISIPPFGGGIYDPSDTRTRDVGLRWATAHWRDVVAESSDRAALVGPDRLQRAAATDRAEAWRLLYVAITRVRDHLVVPLPRSLPDDGRPRDRWLDALRDGLAFDGDETGAYAVDGGPDSSDGGFDVGVNDVDLLATREPPRASHPSDVAVTPPRRDELAPWVPRFVNPSTMYPLTEDPDGFVLDHLLGRSLHTETNDVPDDLPLSFDGLAPEDVGTCIHEVLTTLVERDVAADALCEGTDEVRHAFDVTIHEHAPGIDDAEREALFVFFRRGVLDEFLASDLWKRIERAETVAVERPIDGLVTVGDVEIEVHGEVDFVIDSPSGERHVTDVKIALTEPTPETRRRYELQVAAYAYLFEREATSTVPVSRTIETFGVERETIVSSWPPAVVEHRLATLLDE